MTQKRFLHDIALKFGWINNYEESDSIILREIVLESSENFTRIGKLDAFARLSRSIMKPLIDVPLKLIYRNDRVT